MKLVSYLVGDTPHTGVVIGDPPREIVDLSDPPVGLPADMAALLALGRPAMDAARRAPSSSAQRVDLGQAFLLAPVPVPPKVLGIGLNYSDHIAEMGVQPPAYQVWFNKQRTCVIGPEAAIEVPPVSAQVDYEGELAMIVGVRCRNVSREHAMEVVAGFTVINDVSVRDWQLRTGQFTMGKGFDTHGPCGPWLVTTDEAPDPQSTRIVTRVNGEVRQDNTTAQMIFSCSEMIEHLTSAFTLEPGDVIATGTPAGVGASFDPPRWLRSGDRVEITIDGIGTLENPVA